MHTLTGGDGATGGNGLPSGRKLGLGVRDADWFSEFVAAGLILHWLLLRDCC